MQKMVLNYNQLIENKILKKIITMLEENNFIVSDSCKILIEELQSYQEIDNELGIDEKKMKIINDGNYIITI
jgi:hypothetical protein